MRKFRYQIRDTGDRQLRFGISTGPLLGEGYNVFFGRLFLAVRENEPRKGPLVFPGLGVIEPPERQPFVNLAFGRSQRRYTKRIRKEYKLWKLQNDR